MKITFKQTLGALSVSLVLLGVSCKSSQTAQKSESTIEDVVTLAYKEGVSSVSVVDQPDNMPEYPGGVQAMMTFISENLRYPILAQETGAQGRVLIRFVVGKDGRIKDAEIMSNKVEFASKEDSYIFKKRDGTEEIVSLSKVQGLTNMEAMRVIKSMPTWKAGMQDGKPVEVYFTVTTQHPSLAIIRCLHNCIEW